ncbi:MAG: transcription termination factor Rho [Planctomycetaceae bacterium]
MPSSSSSAEETSSKTPRRTRTSTAKKKVTRKKTTDEASAVSSPDDDFGDGVDEAAAAKPRRRVGRATSDEKPAAEKRTRARRDTSAEESGPSREELTRSVVDDPAGVMEEARETRLGRRGTSAPEPDLSDLAQYFSAGGEDFEPRSSAGSNDSEGDGDRRPRRRRRRRRGRGDSRTDGQTNGGQNGGQNSESFQVQNNGRGRSQRGRGGRQPDRGQSRDRDHGRGGRGRSAGGPPPRRTRTIQPAGEVIEGTFDGVLELHAKGYGFLRDPKKNYAAEDNNPFVSGSVVERYGLREGVLIRGHVGPGTRNQGPRLQEVELIDGYTPDEYKEIKHFDTLTPINPFEQIKLEVGQTPVTMRVMDLLCPIGKGQRALLVAPPRTGKTMLLQDIANSVTQNHPEIHLMVLLIDERPEEVTEMTRSVKGEVIASSLDHDVESHVRISRLIVERGRRLAEEGQDVFILLDSITRLARAFNKYVNPSGRTGRGGLDIRALDEPKKLFGTARRFDEGGSLTVCGTALIDTNNGMDEAIFQEFKGTGNMEMVLSRDLADRRIWPAIDITRSGTRREEKILAPEILEGVTMLRRSLISLSPIEAMEQLTRTLMKFKSNEEFLSRIQAVL